jgi:hypothetical protein
MRVSSIVPVIFGHQKLKPPNIANTIVPKSKSGIRMQNPSFTEEQVMNELRRRIEAAARREEQG